MRSGVLLAVVFGVTSGVVADTIHVPGDYPTIQAAILAALEGDEIIVAPGTYNEAIFFNGHNITLRSESGPEVTTIDASGLNNSVVRIILGEGPATVLQGFTITDGDADNGGGIYCDGSDPTIRDCIVEDNQATMGGGGLYVRNGNLTVTDCRFAHNVSGGGGGGGVSAIGSSDLSFVDCEFNGNSSPVGGGASITSDAVQFTRCLVVANQSNIAAGVNLFGVDNSALLTDCVIRGNVASSNGGGIYASTSPAVLLVNCLVAGNNAGNSGGGMYVTGNTDLTITNCTIAGNSSDEGGGIRSNSSGNTLLIDNCVVWDNVPDSINGPGTINVAYSDIEVGWPGCDFCILADPLFVNPANGDYRLAAGSPCIDLGKNTAVPKGIDADLDGAPRFMDDPDTPDCPQPGANCGCAPIVDMGAYEFPVASCPWDLDGNGSVGASDLVSLLVSWGPCKGCCPADFDGNGTVGASDLLALLVNWGPCP